MQKLGKNHGSYRGDTIDINDVLRDDLEVARQFGWHIEELPVSENLDLLAFTRPATTLRTAHSALRVYLSAGIHGDEPAGPLAVQQLLRENNWPSHAEVRLLPCVNPTGFPLNRRENAHGKDLNRDYRHFETAEVRAHVAWLQRQPAFNLALCLHEDWESQGFYVYELNPDQQPSLAEAMIQSVARFCPIDLSPEIEGRAARGGLINPSLDPNSRPQWPEAFYLIQNKTRLTYTLEAPSDFPLAVRVAALAAGVRAAIENCAGTT